MERKDHEDGSPQGNDVSLNDLYVSIEPVFRVAAVLIQVL